MLLVHPNKSEFFKLGFAFAYGLGHQNNGFISKINICVAIIAFATQNIVYLYKNASCFGG